MKKILYLFLVLPLIFSSCKKEAGCTDPQAANFNVDAEEDDASCTYSVVATWNLVEYTGNGNSAMNSLLELYIISGTWTINSNGTYTTNIVYSDATVELSTGTWSLIGTSTFALTTVDGLENWTITQLNGNSMVMSGSSDGVNMVITLEK